jgi:glycosyltransferase involved in cell wall biosynthesis
MRRWLSRQRGLGAIDVINTHSSTDSWLVALASLTMGQAPPQVRTRHISAAVPNNWTTRWLYGHASRLIVTTGEALREKLVHDNRLDAQRIVSIPTGIDTAHFRPPTTLERRAARARLEVGDAVFVVGIVATLRSWKGHRYLIDALQMLTQIEGQGEWLLVIVGDGPQRAALEGQVASRHLDAHVLFVGNQNDVLPYLWSLDAFALPSYANEGVPQALLQAMACGLPVVTTHAGAISEIARDEESALITPIQDSKALAVALARLRASNELRLGLAQAARRRVEDGYDLESMLTRMEAVFTRARSSDLST